MLRMTSIDPTWEEDDWRTCIAMVNVFLFFFFLAGRYGGLLIQHGRYCCFKLQLFIPGDASGGGSRREASL